MQWKGNTPIGGTLMHSVTDTIPGMTAETPDFVALGAEMRARRARVGISAGRLAAILGVGQATVTRWETGLRKPSAEHIRNYLEAVNVSSQEIDEFLELARHSGMARPGMDGLSAQSRQRAELLETERTASRISVVSPLLVPGLLQVAGYSRAMMHDDLTVPRDEIDTRVAVRLGRKEVLTRKNPVKLLAVLGEGTLCQRIGSSEVMADQMQMLLDSSSMPNVDIRVNPFSAGWNPSLDGLFSLVEFDDREPVVRTENQKSSLVYRDLKDFDIFRASLAQVLKTALDPESSRDLIAKYKEKWE
jgi:transcriptional regulator with XRE-family HTH domain